MRKCFFIFCGLVVFLSSFLISCNNYDDEYSENNKKDKNPFIYNISINSNGNGSVSFEGYTEPFISVASGTTITILATPDEGYEFVGWRIDETAAPANLGLSYTFEVSGDIALTAVFEKEEAQEDVYQVVEQQPEFPGGMSALYEYLSEKTIYPQESIDNNSQGRAYVRFIVHVDGSITDVTLLMGCGDVYLDIEAIRVASAMPNWICGKQLGQPVCVEYTLPITFRLR